MPWASPVLCPCLYLVFDRPGTVVQVVAVSQHVHDLPVPQQGDVVPCLGLPGEEEEEELLMPSSNPDTPFLEQWGHRRQHGGV